MTRALVPGQKRQRIIFAFLSLNHDPTRKWASEQNGRRALSSPALNYRDHRA